MRVQKAPCDFVKGLQSTTRLDGIPRSAAKKVEACSGQQRWSPFLCINDIYRHIALD